MGLLPCGMLALVELRAGNRFPCYRGGGDDSVWNWHNPWACRIRSSYQADRYASTRHVAQGRGRHHYCGRRFIADTQHSALTRLNDADNMPQSGCLARSKSGAARLTMPQLV